VLLEDMNDAVAILEATGRTVPRRKWVDEFVAEDEDAALDGLI
jgi:hypothetical protein